MFVFEAEQTKQILIGRVGEKVRLRRYICLKGHLSGSLEKACNHT
jgi:hypothetical protein